MSSSTDATDLWLILPSRPNAHGNRSDNGRGLTPASHPNATRRRIAICNAVCSNSVVVAN
jgi:hypothetical protein